METHLLSRLKVLSLIATILFAANCYAGESTEDLTKALRAMDDVKAGPQRPRNCIEDEPPSPKIDHGVKVPKKKASAFPTVEIILYTTEDLPGLPAEPVGKGSAILLNGRTILTAGHIFINEAVAGEKITKIRIVHGEESFDLIHPEVNKDYFVHPSYQELTKDDPEGKREVVWTDSKHDLAVIHLDEPIRTRRYSLADKMPPRAPHGYIMGYGIMKLWDFDKGQNLGMGPDDLKIATVSPYIDKNGVLMTTGVAEVPAQFSKKFSPAVARKLFPPTKPGRLGVPVPGDSGGPLLTSEHKILGIASSIGTLPKTAQLSVGDGHGTVLRIGMEIKNVDWIANYASVLDPSNREFIDQHMAPNK